MLDKHYVILENAYDADLQLFPKSVSVVSSILLHWWILPGADCASGFFLPATPAVPGAAHQAESRFSKVLNSPCAGVISTEATRARAGPRCAQAMICATASGLPETTASTRPSARLHTQPVTPSRSASRRMDSRYHTPCTRPVMSRCRVRLVVFKVQGANSVEGFTSPACPVARLRRGRGGTAPVLHPMPPAPCLRTHQISSCAAPGWRPSPSCGRRALPGRRRT